MTVQDMDICLNISAEPALHMSTLNNDESILKLMKAQNNKTRNSKAIVKSKVQPKSVSTIPAVSQKRLKQKSLSTIVARKLKGSAFAKQTLGKGNKIQKKVTFEISPGGVEQKKPDQKIIKASSSVNSKDEDSNKLSSNKDSEAHETPVISFTKVTKENFGKTILARKRPVRDTETKKSLSSIFSKRDESKNAEVTFLGSSREVDTNEDVVPKKKSKLEEPQKSLSTTEEIGVKKKDKEKKKKKKNADEKGANASHKTIGKVSSLFGHNPEIPNIGQRLVKPINEPVFTGTTFEDLNIHPFTISNLKQNMDITEMTIVQQKTIPRILSGKDILVRSQTGSGKTLAYALPIVEFLQKARPKLSRSSGMKALIVVPTRELALQTYECFLKLIKPFTWIVPGYLAGGEKRKAEKARLRRGCNILVGTPGRLLDHIQRTAALKLGNVKYFVLDEADRMFDMGYEKDISGIVSALKVSTPNENTDYDAMKMFRQNTKKVFTEDEVEDMDQKLDTSREIEEESEPEYDANEPVNQRQKYHSSSEDDSNDDEPFIKVKKFAQEKILPNNDDDDHEDEGVVDNQSRRQTILLSATLTQAVEKLAGLTMVKPVFVDAAQENLKLIGDATSGVNEDLVVPQSVTQTYIVTPPKLRMVTLSAYIAGKCQSHGQHKMLVFMATQDMVDYHTEILSSVLGKPVDDEDEDSDPLVDVEFFKLHGSMMQKDRTEVFKTFRQARSGVLLCTDVAARGLDLPKVDDVVQYTGPISATDYVHRIGRTARAGSSGTATIFLTPPEIEFVRMLESRRIRIKQESMDDVLGNLLTPLCKHSSAHGAAIALQNEFETLVLEESKLRGGAVKAYISWMRFYSSYPRNMREAFNRKELHLGHYAKSFALRETPQRIGGIAKKLREKEGDPQQQQQHRNQLANERPDDGVPGKRQRAACDQQQPRSRSLKNVRMLNTSEYGSGLEPAKKPKKS